MNWSWLLGRKRASRAKVEPARSVCGADWDGAKVACLRHARRPELCRCAKPPGHLSDWHQCSEMARWGYVGVQSQEQLAEDDRHGAAIAFGRHP